MFGLLTTLRRHLDTNELSSLSKSTESVTEAAEGVREGVVCIIDVLYRIYYSSTHYSDCAVGVSAAHTGLLKLGERRGEGGELVLVDRLLAASAKNRQEV